MNPMTFDELLEKLVEMGNTAKNSGTTQIVILAAFWSAFKVQDLITESCASDAIKQQNNKLHLQ